MLSGGSGDDVLADGSAKADHIIVSSLGHQILDDEADFLGEAVSAYAYMCLVGALITLVMFSPAYCLMLSMRASSLGPTTSR
jgi:hypothetical protein